MIGRVFLENLITGAGHMESRLVIEAKALHKRFSDKTVISNLNFDVRLGECFGILAPQGSGKSTLMRLLSGLLQPDDGDLFILGLQSRTSRAEINSQIGFITQDNIIDPYFSTRENLELFASYHGLDRYTINRQVDALLKIFRLEDYSDATVAALNTDIQRRMIFARAFVHKPELIIMDQPFNSFKSETKRWIADFIKKNKSEEKTQLLMSDRWQELGDLCDRVAIMDNGRILAVGEPKALILEHIGAKILDITMAPTEIDYYASRLRSQNDRYVVLKNQIHVHLDPQKDPRLIMNMVPNDKITLRPPTLSDVFLKITGHDLLEELI